MSDQLKSRIELMEGLRETFEDTEFTKRNQTCPHLRKIWFARSPTGEYLSKSIQAAWDAIINQPEREYTVCGNQTFSALRKAK